MKKMMKKVTKQLKGIKNQLHENKGGLGAIGGGLIMLLIVAYVAYENKENISTFFGNLWTYIETKIKSIFS